MSFFVSRIVNDFLTAVQSSAFKASPDNLFFSLGFRSEVTVCYITAHENNKESQPEKKGGGTSLWGSSCDPDKIWILCLPIFVTHSLPLIFNPPTPHTPSILCGGFSISAQALRDAVIQGQMNSLKQAGWLSQTLSRTNRFSWSQLIRWDIVVCSHWRHCSSRCFSALTGEGL